MQIEPVPDERCRLRVEQMAICSSTPKGSYHGNTIATATDSTPITAGFRIGGTVPLQVAKADLR
ncbi:hypothetical protein BAUCODRAFT_31674 [Baudoinia panamericana UAMH 10762]|uniref:Uncharacterized protein n=1 Tax=Baudoinia panamericana (strain UAMH 10762) TaxID=717646 RepID=M2NJN5_BAUPA|nr:uncharacterized protein BAUCODRAFT_31674 [Baudoinia panamericana UAMH 10762]EMC99355.1 hypothetical protein BAUCODRAFT_31674 [Baudoinia panamericana UAMH 10762]